MKYPKLRELKEAIIALIKGPVTTKFPSAPHIPYEGFRGKPVPSEEGCIVCGACAEVCPASAIKVCENVSGDGKDIPSRTIEWHYDKCVYCGQCQRYCTTRDEKIPGVKLTKEYDLAGFDRSVMRQGVTKELVLCSRCGEPLTTLAHIKWIIDRLGPLAVGNFTLNRISQQETLYPHMIKSPENIPTIVGNPENKKSSSCKPVKLDIIRRQDLFQVNCPKCRHVVLVFNQTGKQNI